MIPKRFMIALICLLGLSCLVNLFFGNILTAFSNAVMAGVLTYIVKVLPRK